MSTSRRTASPLPALPRRMLFVRHAIAIPAEEFSGSDADRPLTPEGIKRARAVFARVFAHERVDRILTSPYERALATANLVNEALAKEAPVEMCEGLISETTWERWQASLTTMPPFTAEQHVVIVGHEPSLGQLFARHLGHPQALPFKKAGIGILEPDGWTRAKLVAFLPPRLLRS